MNNDVRQSVSRSAFASLAGGFLSTGSSAKRGNALAEAIKTDDRLSPSSDTYRNARPVVMPR